MTQLSYDLITKMRAQRRRNIAQLAKCAKQRRRNERWLKWFGWMDWFGLRESNEDLIVATTNLDEIDHQLDQFIGPRS